MATMRIFFRIICGLTIIRLENPAFNYGFFRPNLLSFAGIDQKTADHGRNLLAQTSENKPAKSCCSVEVREAMSEFPLQAIRRPANLRLSNPWPCGSGRDRSDDRKR